MSIKFKLSRWDIFYSSFIMNFQQPYLITLFILLGLWLSYVSWTGSSDHDLLVRMLSLVFYCIPPICGSVGIMAVVFFLIAWSKNNDTILAEQKWMVNDDLLLYESEYSRSEIKWKALKRVIPTGNYLFLYLSQIGACIIPKRAFASDQDWKQFVQLCRSKLPKK